MTDQPGQGPEQRLPVPREPAEVEPAERFTAPVQAHSIGLTSERAAKIVRQSGNSRWVAFLAVTLVTIFVIGYYFYELGIPGVSGSSRMTKEAAAQQVTDVQRGYKLFQANCARCHGVNGEGGIGPILNDQGKLLTHLTPTYIQTVLEVGREKELSRIINPSSIAAFGPETPQNNTPNDTILKPKTMYGVTKVAGELLGDYYFKRYGLDVRGMRLPGIISWKTPPGGGTTDYAVAIYYEAVQHGKYECFVRENTVLPMMYMPDALKSMIDLANAPLEKLQHHCDFNVTAMSFSAGELAAVIKKHVPGFKVTYKPDFHQAIADSWPKSIDDSVARKEWGWKPTYDLEAMTKDMLLNLRKKFGK